MPAGPLKGLVVDGVIAGIGGVLIFLPQILLLFFFIAILEDSGYMARAAFLMNRHMRRAGLHGRAFIPLLSGFACSIPGIMATRTIGDRRDRLVTMLVVPLVSCSARLPVYALMIAAFVPPTAILGKFFSLQGLVLWCAYLFSLAAAITVAYLLRSTVLRGKVQPFVMELPPYRIPDWRTVLITMWERGRVFLTQAGTIILAMNIVLWFLLSYPANPPLSQDYGAMRLAASQALNGDELDLRLDEIARLESSERMSLSYAGRLGRVIEPALKPLGFDWKIGIGLIGSLAAREVFVATMAVVYGIGSADDQQASLVSSFRREFNTLVGISVMIFFILACQCLATVAIVKRESRSWGWAAFQFGYMTLLAYTASLIFYQVASSIWPELA
jgi:ferrous iron transport protein B